MMKAMDASFLQNHLQSASYISLLDEYSLEEIALLSIVPIENDEAPDIIQ